MGSHRRIVELAAAPLLRLALEAFLLAGLSGCGRDSPPPPGPTGANSARPVDRLAPGEAAPGVEMAHDLALPRGSKVGARFGMTVHAKVPLPPETVANYVRAQSDGAEGIMGPNGTIFPNLRVKGMDVGHHLRVEVTSGPMGDTTLIVDRIEERPAPAALPPEEAMQKAGLNPDGTLIDPDHIE